MRFAAALAILAVGLPGRVAPASGAETATVSPVVAAGLSFLAGRQSSQGAFGDGPAAQAATAQALLAFLGAGDVPDVGRYGLNVRSATDWLLANQSADGSFGPVRRGMSDHATVTLALAEAYGVESDPERRPAMHEALVRAAEFLVTTQDVPRAAPENAGGWGRDRAATDADLRVTARCILALRACRDVGVDQSAALARAGEFVMRCFNPKIGGFASAPGGTVGPGATGAALTCLESLDRSDSAKLSIAVAYLNARSIDPRSPFVHSADWFVAFAAFHRDDARSAATVAAITDRLVKLQEKDGGWPARPVAQSRSGSDAARSDSNASRSGSDASRSVDRVTATALALRTLTIPYQLLPIDRR